MTDAAIKRFLSRRFPRQLSFLQARLSREGLFGLHLTIGTIALIGGAWLFGGIAEDLVTRDPLVPVDEHISEWFRSHATPGLYWSYAFGVGAWVYSDRQHSVRAYRLRFAMEAIMVLAIGTCICRCRRHVPQPHVEGFVRQGKTSVGRAVDDTRGSQFSQRTHDDGNDYLWLPGSLSFSKNQVPALAFSYRDHNNTARFFGRTKQDVSRGTLLKRCIGGDGSRNSFRRTLSYGRGNVASIPRMIIVTSGSK